PLHDALPISCSFGKKSKYLINSSPGLLAFDFVIEQPSFSFSVNTSKEKARTISRISIDFTIFSSSPSKLCHITFYLIHVACQLYYNMNSFILLFTDI